MQRGAAITGKARASLLSGVPLFAGLPQGTLRTVAALAREVPHSAGHAIVSEGAVAHALHVVASGRATVSVRGHVVVRLGPGDFFGEMAVIDRGLRSATVTADEPVITLAIEGASFRRLVESDGRLALRLLLALTARVRGFDQGLGN
ncbi:MAG: cyclic nucleotide-binding domain-containing protein [Actinobacteria bacterium]|nr:cyclic nucleotide-binding domain-containing protein [Actinomycetota bacterium]